MDDTSERVTFALSTMAPDERSGGGTAQIADSGNLPMSRTIAAALVRQPPGSLREMHRHPNADEWQYHVSGEARMTVFNTGPKAQTADFRPGDIGYVKKSLGHSIENTGGTELRFLEIFRAPHHEEVSLSNWSTCLPPSLVAQHLGIDPSTVPCFPNERPNVPQAWLDCRPFGTCQIVTD